jgi:NAD(P)-dependent dehydrogenase (short-subunit alcohol dehydrogenase family)
MAIGSNDVVAVTGGGRGLGLALVVRYAERGLSVLATVEDDTMIADVQAATAGLPGHVRVETLDVCSPGDFAFPPQLRVLVNNAGTRSDYLPVEETPVEDWRRIFEVNVFGLVELTQRAIPVLRAAGGGTICNVTSSSVLDTVAFQGAYRASKAAVSAVCESLRLELAPFGIRIVEVLPGHLLTQMAKDGVMTRLAEAVEFPVYAAMAHRQRELNAQAPPFTAPEVAAQAIVEAILDEDGPMRHGTDPTSRPRLSPRRETDDETRIGEALAAYGLADGAAAAER